MIPIDYQAELAAAKQRLKAKSDAAMANVRPREEPKGMVPIHTPRRRRVCDNCGHRLRFLKGWMACPDCEKTI